MEFTKIISSPIFACSAPDVGLKVQNAGDATLKVSTPESSWNLILSTLTNSAGENLVTVRLRDILSSVTYAPSPSETDADSMLPLMTVSLEASNAADEHASMDIPVAYGNLTGKSPADFLGQWLTSREQVSRTYTWARERLSLLFGPLLLRWSGQVNLKITCKAYFLSGDPETFELASVSTSENTYYIADCSYARIAALAESESPLVAWDLSYTLTGTDADGEPASLESYPQRFLLGRQDERIREFIFINCFGMEDRVFGEGISKRKVDGSSTTFIAGGQKMEVSNDSETVYEAFSGQLADRRSIFHWHDFLSSATRLLLRLADASLTRIVIDSHDSETEDFSVGGINFSYRLSDRHSGYPDGLCGTIGDYDPTQLFGALWVDKNPAAVTPEEGDLFFLKHRLSELPSFNVADELLFLVQSPLTDAWGAFSVGNLKLWIEKFIDNGAKSIRLNALADYETAEGGVIDPAALQNGSIPVWNAAAGAYRPVAASELGDFITGKSLHPLIFEKDGKEVYRYTPDVQKMVLDISDVASAKALSGHISDASLHVTADERDAWNLVASLFGVDADGNVYVKGGKGFYGLSFVSSRGSDPEAEGGAGQGIDEDAMWTILGTPGTEVIDSSHIPELDISAITGLQNALDSKLEGITSQMVKDALGYTPYDAAAIGSASVAYAATSGTAGRVAHALTVKRDGGSPSAADKTFDGGAAVTVTIPTTLPASDVYAWAKAATKPSYTWGEIGGKPTEFTPAEHTHTKSDITDFPTSWAWSAITGTPTTLAGYGIKDGVNDVKASGGLSAGVDGHVLTVGVASGYTIPTSAQIGAWNAVAALFGVDADGNVYVKDGKGFYGMSFVSSRGSDPEAEGGAGQGIDEDAMWTILGTPGTEVIDSSHIPELDISAITGLQNALDSKLEGITSQMVKDALGYTPYDAAAIGSASVAYAATSGTAGRVAHALTVKRDGGSPSAADKTFDGGAAVTVTIPTTLPASDVYAWAKAATKPSYTWGEIGGKPSTLAGYGITDGVNSVTASGGLSASVSGHKLTVGVASGYAMPTSAQIGAWNLVASLFGVDSDGNVYVKGGKGFYGTSFVSSRGSDAEAGSGDSGVDMDAVWDALAAGTTEKINVSHLSATDLASLLTSAGYKLTDTIYTLPKATVSALGGIKAAGVRTSAITTTQGGTTSGRYYGVELDSNGKAFVNVPWVNTTYSLSSFGITATAAEINKLDGLATTATELGYVHGVTSNIQTQLNAKANASALAAYLPLSGGTMTGDIAIPSATAKVGGITVPAAGTFNTFAAITDLSNYKTFIGTAYVDDVWQNVISVRHRNGNGDGSEHGLYLRSQLNLSRSLYWRKQYNGVWGDEMVLLDSSNYTSYTVTKTGGGASGTWGINISGNATSATNATYSQRANYLYGEYTGSGGLQPPSYFKNMGLKVNMMSKPVVYSDVIVVNGYNVGSDVPYINAIGFQKTANDHGEVYHARGDYGGDSWGTWHKFLDSYNYTSYAVSLTGAQTISGAKTFSSPVTAPALTYSQKYKTRCDSVGWYRCFTFTRNNAACPTAILHVSRIFNTSDGESYVFAISLGYDGKVSVTQLSGIAAVRFITKIRVAYVNSSTAYVDFYYSPTWSGGNEVYVSSSGIGISQTPTPVNDTTSSFYEFETADGCKSDPYVTAGQYVTAPQGLFGLTAAQADSYAGSGRYKLAVGQQSPSYGASLLLYRDSTSYQSYIVWSTGSADHADIGIKNGTNDLDIKNHKGAIKLTGQGTLTYNNYTVWHAGNDGSGSGLDADLLDGTQKSGLLTSVASTKAANLSVTVGGTTKSVADLYATYLDGHPATSFDLSTNLGACQDYGCYVIGLMQITDYTTAGNHAYGELILIRQNGNNPTQKIIYSLGTRYNTEDVRFGHLVVGYYSNYAIPCTFTHNGKKWAGFNVTAASSYSTGVVCKRDGLRLGERSTPFLLMYKNSNTGEVLDSEVNGSLVVNGSDITNDGVSTTRFVGALEGNATTATKLATARTLWGQSFDGSGNIGGDMTGVGLINGALHIAEQGDDLVKLRTRNHYLEFSGYGYMHKSYYFRPGYSSAGATNASVYIQNASASDNPTFTTTHAFDANGNATHSGALSAGSSITSGGHLFLKAASGRFIFNSDGSGFMMSMESGNFRLMSHNSRSYVARLVDVDMSGNVGIKAAPASGYALHVAGAGYFSSLLLANAGIQIGATSDIGWYLNSSRITAGTQVARGVNVGNLLVSNVWADYTKVPANGIYAKGAVLTDGYLQVGSGRLRWDAANNALYVEKSDGTACGLYAKGYMSARGSDPEAATGGSSELVPVVTLSKLTVGTNVSISVLANAGLTNDVLEKMRDGAVGRIKAVFSDGSTEIWPVLHASEGFISFGYDTVAGGYQDTMNIYEITIPSKTTVIRVEHFER